jgi:hypothetical protein
VASTVIIKSANATMANTKPLRICGPSSFVSEFSSELELGRESIMILSGFGFLRGAKLSE